MDPTVNEWLSLVLRWLHVITGIAWIGSSFYFMWLDARLVAPTRPRPQVESEIWLVHSGGFYLTERRSLKPGEMPRELHWFKWEAAFTWLSGFALLVVAYYLGAGVVLARADGPLGDSGWAVVVGLATLVLGWLIYDFLWTSPLGRLTWPPIVLSFALLVGVAFLLTWLLDGRAAFLHVGAMLGTIMAANVWVRILPAQQVMIDATKAGREFDPAPGMAAKKRSVHNNYMTLPVLFLMISNHYPATYGAEFNWAILIVMFLVGAGVRHYFNIRHQPGVFAAWIWLPAAAAVVALMVVTMPEPLPRSAAASTETATAQGVPYAAVQAVLQRHCVACHAARPTNPGFDKPPKNVMFESPEQVVAAAPRIYQQAIARDVMPLGNQTGMTAEERALIGRWIADGARVE